jgi:hypothetical protein
MIADILHNKIYRNVGYENKFEYRQYGYFQM